MINRITSSLINSNLVKNMQNSYANYAKLTAQLASGKKINSMLDDSIQSVNIVNSKREVGRIDTWSENIKVLQNEINQSSATIDLLTENAQRVKDLATSAANNIYNKDSLQTVMDEVDNIISSMVSNANTNYDGKYIFSGTNTKTAPYTIEYGIDANGNKTDEIVGIKYNGTKVDGEWKRELEIADGVFQNANVIGIEFLGECSDGNSEGIFGDLIEFRNTLKDIINNQNGASYEDITKQLDGFTNSIDKIIRANSKLGSVASKLDMSQTSLNNNKTNLTEKISNMEDVDLTEAVTNWYTSQYSYQASMQVFSAFNSMSLLNYM